MRREARTYHKPGTDILDIGANIGYNTLIFSDYGPVIAFEPVFHQIVKLNVQGNTLRHDVQVAACALSDTKEVREMNIPAQGCQSNTHINYGGTSLYTNETIKTTPVTVNCERLDDIYDGVPSLMKIDVEGHELGVLRGAEKTIKKHKPVILIEIHDFTDDHEVHVFLKSLGYDVPIKKPEAMYLYT
jgi:FkbM family methyltransferase